MTQWTDERVPLWVPPLPGEALDSWLEAYARRLFTTTPEFIRFLGMTNAQPALMVRRLTDPERNTLARRTGAAPDGLTALTLEPWDGLAVSIEPAARLLGRPPAWRHHGNHTRYCPLCLSENHGRWPLAWRLPWSFSCTRHNLLLLDYCPRCGHEPPVASLRRSGPSRPGECLRMTSRGKVSYCGFPLAEAPYVALPGDGLVLSAQQDVEQTILRPTAGNPSARQRAQELYALARRVLRSLHERLPTAPALVHSVLAECGGDLPPLAVRHEGNDAHNAAVGTALANVVHDACTPGHSEVLAWLREAQGEARGVIEQIERWLPAGPSVTARLLASVDSQVMLLTRIRYGTAGPDPAWPTLDADDLQLRASRAPVMLWPSWTMQLLPAQAASPVLLDGFRRACATLLMLAESTLELGQASALLANASPTSNRRALDAALVDCDPKLLAATLASLARALDTQPTAIDYARRRSVFNEDTVALDLDAYRELCRHHGERFAARQYDHARWHLLSLLLGAHPGGSSRAPAWHGEFQLRLTPHLREFLHRQAAAHLAANGIDEPVQWEPPLDWTSSSSWPVIHVGAIDHAPLAAIDGDGLSAAEAARTVGLGEAHLLLFLEAVGVTRLPSAPGPATRGRPVPRQGRLAPEALRELYEERELSQRQIAKLASCRPNTVRRALLEADIPLRKRRPPGSLARLAPREWLEHEYLNQDRSVVDISRELGIHPTNVERLLTSWNIPLRSGRWQSNPFANLNVVPSPTMRRISTTRGCLQRLRRITEIPGHPTLKSAALSLSTAPDTLGYQLKRIEHTAGFQVIARTHPLTPTPEGQELLDEAVELLRLLDRQPATLPRQRPISYSE